MSKKKYTFNNDMEVLEASFNKIIKLTKKNQRFYKSYGLGRYFQSYSKQLERDINKKRRRPQKYQPGTLVFVDFGMNFGCEFSKPHFAIVLTKNDSRNKRTITVVPLTSKPGKEKLELKFSLSSAIVQLIPKIVSEYSDEVDKEIVSKLNERIPNEEEHLKKYEDINVNNENYPLYKNLMNEAMIMKMKSLLEIREAKKQQDKFFKSDVRTTYVAINNVTTIDKNKIFARNSKLDVLGASVVNDENLKLICDKIRDNIIS